MIMFTINNRIKNLRIKLIATAGAAVVIIFCYIFDISCIFLTLFGFPCISCGMTRAWLAALRFDFFAAFAFHPMFWAIPILYLYILFDAKLFKNKIINWTTFGLIAVGFLINYIFVLVIH
ncbi:MAG: DUF2752 domain-containing protein [Ruminococcus sp.]|nr:DUF2752 domain-containing protein [Ruminococcus sp.]